MKKIVVVLNSNTNRHSAKKNIRFEHELLAEIEEVRPDGVSFSEWVKDACREKLNQVNSGLDVCARANELQQSDVYTEGEAFVRTSVPEAELTAEVLAAQWHKQGMYYQQIAERLNQLGKLSPRR
jgi:hypothetical protein